MHRSFLIKLLMLMAMLGLILVFHWPLPDPVERKKSVLRAESGSAEVTRSLRAKATPLAAERIRLDINRSSIEELEALPGIGLVLAERIMAYRKSVGEFQGFEELRAVKGIGVKKLEQLRPYIMIKHHTRSKQG